MPYCGDTHRKDGSGGYVGVSDSAVICLIRRVRGGRSMSKKSRGEEERNRFHERTILLGDQALTHYHPPRYAEALPGLAEGATRYAVLQMFFLVAHARLTMGDI